MELDIDALQMLPGEDTAALGLECPTSCLSTCTVTCSVTSTAIT